MKLGIISALIVGLSSPLVASPPAHAEPLLILPGAEYVALDLLLPDKPAFNRYYTHGIDIGRGFFPSATPTIVSYPASMSLPGSIADHVQAGVTKLDAAIKALAGPAVIAGQSQGAVSADLEQARLQNDPDAPAADQLTFSVFSDPLRGIMTTVFPNGTRIPFVGLTVTPPVESRYNTIVVTNEYDLWSDFPDRPWNLLALLNAMAGATLTHARASTAPSDVPPENISVTTNTLGATTTTYLVPAQQLPLTQLLRLVLADKVVDAIDSSLRPAIDAGYSRNDAPGSTAPYLSHGVIRTGTPAPSAVAPAAAPTPAPESAPVKALAPAQVSAPAHQLAPAKARGQQRSSKAARSDSAPQRSIGRKPASA